MGPGSFSESDLVDGQDVPQQAHEPHLYQGQQLSQVGVKLESHLFRHRGLQSPHPRQEWSSPVLRFDLGTKIPCPERFALCAPAANPVTLGHVFPHRHCWHWPTYYRSTVEEKGRCAHPQEERLACSRGGVKAPVVWDTEESSLVIALVS